MTNSIADLLPKERFEEPSEVRIIKDFIWKNYQQTAKVSVHTTQIIIQVPSSALAGALRVHLHNLQQLCQTNKRLILRIGS
ncbi:hypothetical protein KC968_00230 [Candidatus Saccharibacteria bacterium]|nr:hypothetical protein [Candidatus Saccharibacteria bacterium]